MSAQEPACRLCHRVRPLTFHHLIPRTLHRKPRFKRAYSREELNEGVMLCRDCHDAVHRFVSEKDLGSDYRTLEALRAHPEIARFVAWVKKRKGRHRMKKGPRR